MTAAAGPIYEVTFFADREVVADFDQWLEEHVRETLRYVAIADCRIIPLPDDDHGLARRICQHLLETDEALDDFVDLTGARIESDIAATFGEQVAVTTRVLRQDETFDAPGGESSTCLNCGSRLSGQYCGNCGQRSRSRLISLWELISDAFGDLFELDSRLWQTLVPLMTRPGRLTHDYLQGRRARYMPPFRMYLVMSLVFFVIAFFDPREELGLLFVAPEAQPEITTEDNADVADEATSDDDCDIDASNLDDMPNWLASRLTIERVTHICERVQFDDGRSFTNSVNDNIPAALIVLLPLMALVLKALYPLSRRYYVEHLLFFVHFHAFFFLILTLQVLFARLGRLVGLPDAVVASSLVATSFYVPIYLFVAMRRVYGQGRFVTFMKFIVLMVAYIAGFALTMLSALAIAAFSI